MTDDELEAQLRAHYRSNDPGQPPARLSLRVSEALDRRPSASRPQVRFRPALGIGLGVVILAMFGILILAVRPQATGVLTGSPSPSNPTQSAPAILSSPSALATSPYQLTVLEDTGSPLPLFTVTSAADCQPMPTDWLRSFCSLVLRSDWRTIIAPTDPFGPPPNAYSSVTFLASIARAEISGDTTLCSDVAMREWISASPGGAAPPAGPTNAPKHPVATCIETVRAAAAKGSFIVTDPDQQHNVMVVVDPGAVERAAAGSPPAFDPTVECLPGLTRDACDVLIEAVANDADSRATSWQDLRAGGPATVCDVSGSPCPRPAGGTWLGVVLVGLSGNGEAVFDVAEVNGQTKVTEVQK